MSVEGLSRLIDPSQLTADLGGSLEYDHVEWTELRLGLEEFSGAALQLLAQIEHLEAGLQRQPEPQDVDEARKYDHYRTSTRERLQPDRNRSRAKTRENQDYSKTEVGPKPD